MANNNYFGHATGRDIIDQINKALDDGFTKSQEIKERVDETQEKAKRKEAQRLYGKKNVSEEEVAKLFENYLNMENMGQYLVNGAILTCDQATWKKFTVPEECEPVTLDKASGYIRHSTPPKGKYVGNPPIGRLIVKDDDMTINNEKFATIKDAVQGENVFPFFCNCRIPTDRYQETDAIVNDAQRNQHGVCIHLMDIDEEWENLPLNNQVYKTKCIANENGEAEYVPCITMTSVLFCKHGGLITPLASGQSVYEQGYVTRKTLESVGFENITNESIMVLNTMLYLYDITSLKEIRHFLSQSVVESCKGKYLTEKNWNQEEHPDDVKYFNEKYRDDNGNTEEGDGYRFRGGGYLQLTGRANYQDFADYLEIDGRKDNLIMVKGADRVAEKYAWGASCEISVTDFP